MRIIMISGSPRDESRSLELLERMKEYLPDDVTDVMQIREGADLKTAAIKASEYEAVILETPLYIDGLPSVFLRFLGQLEQYAHGRIPVIASVHCGFYEADHCETALQIIENWADHAGYIYKGGIGIGAAEALPSLKAVKTGRGALRKIGQGYEKITKALKQDRCANIYASVSIPRFIYKAAVEAGWRRSIRKNGLEAKDLDNRMTDIRSRGRH